MKADKTVQKIIEKIGTRDVFEIARKAGVAIIYEDWYPTTIGEFNKKEKTICVNRRALSNSKNSADLEQIIIAHELGHFFAEELNLEKEAEEKFARDFAQELIGKGFK